LNFNPYFRIENKTSRQSLVTRLVARMPDIAQTGCFIRFKFSDTPQLAR